MIVAIVVAILAIQPNVTGVNGAKVIYLAANSYLGNLSALGSTTLGINSIVTSINGIQVTNAQQFYSVLNSTARINSTVTLGYENELFPYIYGHSTVTLLITKTTPL